MPLGMNSFYRLLPACVPNESFRFGVAVFVSDYIKRQLHIGVLYRADDNSLKFGDVANHLYSRIFSPRLDGQYAWVELDIDEFTAAALAARAEVLLQENHGKIPYSVASWGRVWKDGIWVGDEPGQGLTCATFVLSVFTEVGLDLLTTDGWIKRPDDATWAEGIAKEIHANAQGDVSDEHLNAQLARIGESIRVRPMDVAVACKLFEQSRSDVLCQSDIASFSNYWESVLLDPV